MLHCFRALGVNIALDVLSGAVHVLDDMAFEALTDLEAGRDPRPALLAKYSPEDVDELLNEIEALRAQDRSRLLCCDAMDALARLAGESFDVVFLDPPYRKGLVDKALAGLVAAHALAPGCVIVAETAQEEAFAVPEALCIADSRKYGKSRLHFLARA